MISITTAISKNNYQANNINASKNTEEPQGAPPVQQACNPDDIKAAAQKYAQELSSKYGITFIFSDIKNKYQIADYAENSNNRYSVVLSEEMLCSMMSDPQKSAEFENLLKNFKELYMTNRVNTKAADKAGIIINSYGEASFWELEIKDPKQEQKEKAENIIAQMNEITRKNAEINSKKKKDSKKDKNKNSLFSVNVSKKFSPKSSMIRIAQANSVPSTRKIISSLYAERYSVKVSGASKKEMRAIEQSIEYVIQKARVKIKGLEKEQISKLRIKKAAAAKQVKRAAMMAYELKKQQTGRKSREYGQAIAFYGPNGIIHYMRKNKEYDEDDNAIDGLSDYAADVYVPSVAMPSAPAAPPVSSIVSAAVSVDVMNVSSGTLSVYTMPSINVSV